MISSVSLLHLYYNFDMKKNRIHKTEIIILVLFLFFLMIIIGIFFKDKEDEIVIEETKEIKKIDYSLIHSVSGKYSYEDENFTSLFGIDVSEFQEDIDWKKVKEDDVEFAYLRIGRRGATTGLLYEDPKFEKNYQGAKENGILIGVYFFSQAVDEKEAKEEARWVIDHLKDKQIDLPIVYDCEEVYLEDEVSRMEGLDQTQISDNAIAFLKQIQKSGYDVMVYTYPYWAENFFDMKRISAYPIWLARYGVDEVDFDYPIRIWQYSEKGTINGISQATDLNIMFIEKETDTEE